MQAGARELLHSGGEMGGLADGRVIHVEIATDCAHDGSALARLACKASAGQQFCYDASGEPTRCRTEARTAVDPPRLEGWPSTRRRDRRRSNARPLAEGGAPSYRMRIGVIGTERTPGLVEESPYVRDRRTRERC
jgi:hypothetical protein